MAPVRPVPLLTLLLLLPAPALATPLEQAADAYATGDAAKVLKLLPAPTSPEGRLLRARALMDTGKQMEAARLLWGLQRTLPLVGDLVHVLRGDALLAGKRHSAAAAAYRAAIRWKGSRFEDRARLGLAHALAQGRRWRQAVKAYGRLLHLYPEHPERPAVELAMVKAMEQAGWRTQAAGRYREIWLLWPASAAAVEAREALDRLRRRGVKVEPAPWNRRLIRVRKLRRHKLYATAVKEIAQLRRLHRRETGRLRILDMELARTHLRTGDNVRALPLLSSLYAARGNTVPRSLRWKLAGCLADLGRVDEGVRILMDRAIYTQTRGRNKGPRVRGSRVADAWRAVTLLSWHGRYKKALAIADRYPDQLARKPSQKRRRVWLAYRTGQYDRAITGFAALMGRGQLVRHMALYWQARAHQRAGRAAKAQALYKQLMHKHPRTYYAILARSRMQEAGKVKVPTSACAAPRKKDPRAGVTRQLAALRAKHGRLLPGLGRVQLLWRLGLSTEARRELRLMAVDLLWIRYRGRNKRWIIRPSLERIWRGAPVRTRRWNRRAREVFKEGQPLRSAVGKLSRDAGVFYLGWRLGRTGRDPAEYRFPRAYQRLVAAETGKHRLDPNMLWAIMRTESAYRPDAVSPVDATGLMQIMPYTGRLISEAMKLKGHKHHLLFEPSHNLRMSGWYLRQVMNKFKGQLPLVAAAYNGGPHNVARWLRRRGSGMLMDEFIEEITFRQSRLYAKKVIRLVALYKRVHCGKDDTVLANKLDVRYKAFPTF